MRRKRVRLTQARDNPTSCCPELMSKRERLATPIPFRDLLLGIARTAKSR